MLASHLEKNGIPVVGITFMRQIGPRNHRLFAYCFFVSIVLRTKLDKVGTFNFGIFISSN